VGEDEAILAGEGARVGRISPFRTSPWSVPATSRSSSAASDRLRAPPEHLADHSRTLQDRALERLEPVEPRGGRLSGRCRGRDRLDVSQGCRRRRAPASAPSSTSMRNIVEEEGLPPVARRRRRRRPVERLVRRPLASVAPGGASWIVGVPAQAAGPAPRDRCARGADECASRVQLRECWIRSRNAVRH
jgi:hypothetical protein